MPNYSYLFDQPTALFEKLVGNIEKVIVGKREVIERIVIALLCGGHVLLEDVPGTGKTVLVRAIARTIDGTFKRIQFTPDLLPSDVTGVSVFNRQTMQFEFRPGPIMASLVLADELNRTSPKTQAAMLEAMEERKITVDGTTYPLPQPFLIIATQNPVEHEGTYSLPEAQMDRFLMKLSLGYPSAKDEVSLLNRMEEKDPLQSLSPVLVPEELAVLQKEVRRIHVDDVLKEYIVQLAAFTRQHPDLTLGVSPRASLSLMRAAQGRAFAAGRRYCIADDVKTMASCVWSHRLVLTSESRYTGKIAGAVIEAAVRTVTVPVLRQAASG